MPNNLLYYLFSAPAHCFYILYAVKKVCNIVSVRLLLLLLLFGLIFFIHLHSIIEHMG